MPLASEAVDRIGVLEAEVTHLRAQLASARQVQEAGEAQRLAMLELKHRTKNILSVVQSLINHTLVDGTDFAEARDRLGQRTAAMGRAIDLLLQTDWQTTDLAEAAANALVHKGAFEGRIIVEVPTLPINADATLALTMAIHELESNAVKYGALSNRDGHVLIRGRVHADTGGGQDLELSWVEAGGPAVAQAEREGFGTRLITTVPSRRLGATAKLLLNPGGAEWQFRGPLHAIAG